MRGTAYASVLILVVFALVCAALPAQAAGTVAWVYVPQAEVQIDYLQQQETELHAARPDRGRVHVRQGRLALRGAGHGGQDHPGPGRRQEHHGRAQARPPVAPVPLGTGHPPAAARHVVAAARGGKEIFIL